MARYLVPIEAAAQQGLVQGCAFTQDTSAAGVLHEGGELTHFL